MTIPLATPTAIAIFITIWWVVLFAVLPIGVTSQSEAESDGIPGADPGAPVRPRLLIKALITTILTIFVFTGLIVYINTVYQA